MVLFGCGKKTYKVDYCGEQDFYENAKDSYREGEKVTLKYGLIATDTDYNFYLDGEAINCNYEGGAYVLQFVMPAHDIKIECRTKNTMMNSSISVSVLNKVTTTDIWIIPDTEENRKTSVWGTATISSLEVEISQIALIPESIEEDGMYLIRMIDENQMFYSADGIRLEDNQSIVIYEDNGITIIEVYAEDGAKISEYEMFSARL